MIGAIVGAVGLVAGLAGDDNGAQGANDASAQNSRQSAQISGEQWDYYKQHYQPLESKTIADANNVGNPAEQEAAASRAAATVAQAKDAEIANAKRQQMSFGVRPSSDAAIAMDRNSQADKAAMTATAGNDARENAKWMGRQYRQNVVNSGKGIPGQAISGLNSAAGTQMNIGTNAFNRSQTMAQNAGYAAAPFVKSATDWFNKGGGSGTFGSGPMTGAQANPGAYGDMGSFGSSGGGFTGLADGGPVPDVPQIGVRRPDGPGAMEGPGVIHGPGTGTSDDVPANIDGEEQIRVADGEYIIPADVVRAKGEEFFDKLIKQYHKPVNRGFGVRRAA